MVITPSPARTSGQSFTGLFVVIQEAAALVAMGGHAQDEVPRRPAERLEVDLVDDQQRHLHVFLRAQPTRRELRISLRGMEQILATEEGN